MAVLVAVPDTREGHHALVAATAEAQLMGTNLLVLNLGAAEVDLSAVPPDLPHEVIDRLGPGDRDPAEAVLDEIKRHPEISRLVIGVRRRSPMGKALLGSLSQRLLLECPIPVLAVKAPAAG